jgi:hypothetical protein
MSRQDQCMNFIYYIDLHIQFYFNYSVKVSFNAGESRLTQKTLYSGDSH